MRIFNLFDERKSLISTGKNLSRISRLNAYISLTSRLKLSHERTLRLLSMKEDEYLSLLNEFAGLRLSAGLA